MWQPREGRGGGRWQLLLWRPLTVTSPDYRRESGDMHDGAWLYRRNRPTKMWKIGRQELDRQTDTQTDRHTDRQTHRQTDMQTSA